MLTLNPEPLERQVPAVQRREAWRGCGRRLSGPPVPCIRGRLRIWRGGWPAIAGLQPAPWTRDTELAPRGHSGTGKPALG